MANHHNYVVHVVAVIRSASLAHQVPHTVVLAERPFIA